MLSTPYSSKKSSCCDLVVILHPQKKDSLNVSILRASQTDASDVTPWCYSRFQGKMTSQTDASDVTSWCYSRFQGKMTIPGYQFRDSLQFMHRKCSFD